MGMARSTFLIDKAGMVRKIWPKAKPAGHSAEVPAFVRENQPRPPAGCGPIFDMDGTLADTEEVHRLAFNKAFEEFGLPIRWDPAEHRRRLPAGAGRQRLAALFAEEPLARLHRGADAERLIAAVHERQDRILHRRDRGRPGRTPPRRAAAAG